MPPSKSLSQPTRNEAYQFHPSQLSGKERAHHVVKSLLAYNAGIIQHNPTGAKAKFTRLLESPYVFMRGTADLMYRDLNGTDADKSMVLCMGDVHLENYGVMESDDGSLLWGLNDFDEANFAPFSWDVKRGATSIILAATDPNRKKSFSHKKAQKMAEKFAKAYLGTIFKGMQKENYHFTFDQKNSPKLIEKILKESAEVKAGKFLRKKYLDPKSSTPQFKETDEVRQLDAKDTALRKGIEDALDAYLISLGKEQKSLLKKLKVWDIATKTGSGTGSIGLWRYYVLVAFGKKEKTQLMVLELKQERESVLAPYVGGGLLKFASEGSRVAYAEHIHLPNANPFYGYTQIGEISYLVRKRSPHKMRVDLAGLKKADDFADYAKACGKALALAHLHSDSIMLEVYPNIAESILYSVNLESFASNISGFASNMANQIFQDWTYFNWAHEEGVFDFGS